MTETKQTKRSTTMNALALLVLALSATLCTSIDLAPAPMSIGEKESIAFAASPEGQSMVVGEIDNIVLSPTGQRVVKDVDHISPTGQRYIKKEVRHLGACMEDLSAGGLDECVVAVYDVVESRHGGHVPWENKCCNNLLRLESACWDLMFPQRGLGLDLVPGLIGYCKGLSNSPGSAPVPGKLARARPRTKK